MPVLLRRLLLIVHFAEFDSLVQDLYSKLRIRDSYTKSTASSGKDNAHTVSHNEEDFANTFPKKAPSFFSFPNLKGPESYLLSSIATANAAATKSENGESSSEKSTGENHEPTSTPISANGRLTHEGLVIVVDLLLSNYRHVKFSSSKIV